MFLKKYNKILPIVFSFIIMGLLYVLYTNWVYGFEVQWQASMDDIMFVEKFLSSNLSISDFFKPFGEHGMLGYRMLVIINAIIFSYTSFFDLWLNIVNVSIVSFVFLYFCFFKNGNYNLFTTISGILMFFVLFNPMQGSSLSMESQVRLGFLFFVISAPFADKVICGLSSVTDKLFFLLTSFLCLILFGTVYSFAGAASISAIALLYAVKYSVNKKNALMIIVIYFIFSIIYSLCFLKGIGESASGVSSAFADPRLFSFAYACYLGSWVLGYSAIDGGLSSNSYFLAGCAIFVIGLACSFNYIQSGLVKKTTLPLIFLGYSVIVGFLILFGRLTLMGPMCGASYWYHVHTKIGLAAIIWICISLYNFQLNKKSLMSFFVLIATFFLFLLLSIGFYYELRRAPHARNYMSNLSQVLLLDPNKLVADKNGNSQLMAPVDTTKHCLNVLRQYKLSQFALPETFDIIQKNHSATPLHVSNWGPRETTQGNRFNIQPNGFSAMWVAVKGVSRHSQTYVKFGDSEIRDADLSVQNDVVTFIVRDSLVQESGKYQISIIEGDTNKETIIGDFIVHPLMNQ